MSKTLHFKHLRDALRWRNHHRRWRIGGVTVTGNAPLKKPPSHMPLELVAKVVAFAHAGLAARGQMYYSTSANRSQLFNRKPGDFIGAHADCSQFVSSILHWVGCKKVDQYDYTGTLLQKGKHISSPKVGCVVIFGAAPGEHAALITEKDSHGWWTIGFGHQGAPDRVTLANMRAYFDNAGHPGVTYLDFLS